MEAAVFMPSGTMTNQVAVRTHTQPGDELLIEQYGHIYGSEAGGAAALSGVSTRLIHGERGMFLKDDLVNLLRRFGVRRLRPRLTERKTFGWVMIK